MHKFVCDVLCVTSDGFCWCPSLFRSYLVAMYRGLFPLHCSVLLRSRSNGCQEFELHSFRYSPCDLGPTASSPQHDPVLMLAWSDLTRPSSAGLEFENASICIVLLVYLRPTAVINRPTITTTITTHTHHPPPPTSSATARLHLGPCPSPPPLQTQFLPDSE